MPVASRSTWCHSGIYRSDRSLASERSDFRADGNTTNDYFTGRRICIFYETFCSAQLTVVGLLVLLLRIITPVYLHAVQLGPRSGEFFFEVADSPF